MTTPDEIVAMELARLSAAFVSQLPEQVQAVEDEMTAWLDAPRDAERFEILSHRVHQLKGSGSTFGHPGISAAARALEERISAYRRGMDSGELRAPADVESAMAQLQNEARRARTQASDPEGNS
ncbi:MAG: Hpt domain-containing protein [Gammaproteobacteria bacterium]|nr:Hpt domain-containing protein [Gammaproteobacteria bacterium]MDH3847200.1 Hpt domain-containing protein [Gammaproteobacteria bacterium]MDH3863254.1 Hpt domain-containing protein [Gammaproteobacteria bacterium]MDH3904816.1 Hpt domain-containing protein [Gammaproteobacteria bacterium]MDH3907688.1 Hpt domain-containing protein [Gammaproteobacteria bacterium]